ncbi:MAG TPA: DEAD/DEAH box helicase family protein [Anaerohalosphaeraceae bacterium]|nr:DEAD/DEAH box helicase family protein [Anaerohalosphaeraceae bacterium]HQG05071.1 DEAD/DEAH box helicase family protein [Anaerohalosphaeraceae bacterium]HQI06244.1 DEAD/DEAH box helicase family protein [Anaerohalosphaeraceae bacterium]HQJ67136.1 DEAD/DEAH box helicase family protein [Anaerohalosphaeraceae bacterium]
MPNHIVAYSEADTRAKLIDPALHQRGWTEDLIRREQTAGSIEIINGTARRRAKGKVDYLLRVKVNPNNQPVAVALIEAKRNTLPPAHGLDQAKGYSECKRLNVPFVFSSNGYLFVEFDRYTGITTPPRPLSEFPTPDELRSRYEQKMGFNLESEEAKPLLTPYTGGEGTRRYYQDAAIRAVLEKIVQCRQKNIPPRALLALATGSGKTFIAVNLLKRISDAGQLKRALFVCDRDELRTQALGAFQNVFGSNAAEVYRNADGKNNARNARIHIATYQTLGVAKEDDDATFLTEFYPENYFSHVIIDECHRSAWGKWSQVLTRNSQAVQIGLTATPRQLKIKEKTHEAIADEEITANNLKYFGEPVYEYDMAQAIEDGYLAACEIYKGRVNLDDTGITKEEIIARNPVDALTGQPLSPDQIEDLYERYQYEDKILLPDRVLAMCQDLFKYLLETGGPEQKTIIFCARDRHADDVAVCLNNLYADWCAKNHRPRLPNYAFKCTAASSGNDQLPDLRASTRSHFIATTVDLLTTGVDVPCVRNIVFFKYLKSPISFYQMVGRGTRIDLPTNKLMFRVYDYTDATRLFGEEFITAPTTPKTSGQSEPTPPPAPPKQVLVDGFEVYITDQGRYIVTDVDGQAMPVEVEEYKQRLAEKLLSQAHTLDQFRTLWVEPPARQDLLDTLVRAGYSPSVVKLVEKKEDYDLYDVLAELGWGANPRTKRERAFSFAYKHQTWLNSFPKPAADAIRAIAAQFETSGTEGLESPHIFETPEVRKAGGLDALQQAGSPDEIYKETKIRIFAA